jgi:hypothetical protein
MNEIGKYFANIQQGKLDGYLRTPHIITTIAVPELSGTIQLDLAVLWSPLRRNLDAHTHV